MRKPFLLLFLLVGCCMANAKIQLPQLFQSGMVVQRGKPIPVWGKADPQEQIVIRWQKKQYTTTADEQGKWRIDLPKTKAGGPYTLTIGEHELTDVLVGDVWLCSGQSNIDVHIERVYPQYVDEIDHFDNNQIRLFRVRNATNTSGVQDDIMPTAWKPLTKENAWSFSALGTFLGIRMFEKTHVPQGVIVNSWGGTPIEAWLSADSLAKDNPQLLQKTRLYDNKDYVAAQMRANNSADRQWNQMLDEQDPGIANHYTALDCDDASWNTIDQNNWGWRGTGSTWLRQHIQIDKAHAGQPARLLLGTLFDADITYVNGQQVGRTYYQYPPRRYDIPEGVLREGDNVITIRFINKYGMAHFIPEKPYMLCFGADRFSQNPMPKDVIALSNKWLHHAGAEMPSCPSGDVSLQNLPTTLYNAVLYPLAPYALSGIVWYQGESNTGNPAPYAGYLKKLIGGWRSLWQEPTLPFCVVQLANYDGRQQTAYPRPITPQLTPTNSGWAQLREIQRQATLGDQYAETACLIDLGETVDIHPLRKKEAAERVALCMDRLVYGKTVALSPQPVGSRVEDAQVAVIFDQPMREGVAYEVEVAGADKHFVNVEATVKGAEVLFQSPIAQPVWVRYAWKDDPTRANIYNKKGMPAMPFEYELTR
ncbi:sialate O-acetylesterase [Prevotellaceae bacterium HUN156]|nr:sialate O-acetylesterase [Prevotellaceae bacterium HUN156]